jgi:long-chain acyl-CoA synthetase
METDISEVQMQRAAGKTTIYEVLSAAAAKYPDKPAFFSLIKGVRMVITYQELIELVGSVSSGLRALGMKKGDVAGIFSANRPEWAIADLAAMKAGCVTVPLYTTLSVVEVRHIINDSKMKLIFVDDMKTLDTVNRVKKDAPGLEYVVMFDELDYRKNFIDGNAGQYKNAIKYEKLKSTYESREDADPPVMPEDLATIVYTSGTTSRSKGVMLSHYNITSNALACKDRLKIYSSDIYYSFLPLSHMFERTAGYYAMLFSGAAITYASDLSKLTAEIKEIRPTILLTVPRVLEKVYNTVMHKVESGGMIRKALVKWSVSVLNAYENRKYKKERIGPALKIKVSVLDFVVARNFRAIAGGRLRYIISGGAPLDRQMAKVFYIMGFNILEGYGMTETSPVIACNTPEENTLGTVGKPFDGLRVKIGEGGEILVKGPGVMTGYLGMEEETKKAMDTEGWLHTGDMGAIDEKGNLAITGRIKDIIVTSYGKKVAPEPIEAQILKSRYLKHAMLYGDNRKFIIALLVPDEENIRKFSAEKELPMEYDGLLRSAEINGLINEVIKTVNKKLAQYEQIKGFVLVRDDFTAENGMMTPTLKLKRKSVAGKYMGLLDDTLKQLEEKHGK